MKPKSWQLYSWPKPRPVRDPITTVDGYAAFQSPIAASDAQPNITLPQGFRRWLDWPTRDLSKEYSGGNASPYPRYGGAHKRAVS